MDKWNKSVNLGIAALSERVALGSPSRSLGDDAQAECKETPRPRKPRKRRCLTRFFWPLEVGFDPGGGFAPNPGGAGGGELKRGWKIAD